MYKNKRVERNKIEKKKRKILWSVGSIAMCERGILCYCKPPHEAVSLLRICLRSRHTVDRFRGQLPKRRLTVAHSQL